MREECGEFHEVGAGEAGEGAAGEGAAGLAPGDRDRVAAADRAGERAGEGGGGVRDAGQAGGGWYCLGRPAAGGGREGEGHGDGLGGGDAVAVHVVHDLVLEGRDDGERAAVRVGAGQPDGVSGVAADLGGPGELVEGGVDGRVDVRGGEGGGDGAAMARAPWTPSPSWV